MSAPRIWVGGPRHGELYDVPFTSHYCVVPVLGSAYWERDWLPFEQIRYERVQMFGPLPYGVDESEHKHALSYGDPRAEEIQKDRLHPPVWMSEDVASGPMERKAMLYADALYRAMR